MCRIRVRTLMMVVAVLAVLMGAVGPVRRTYRRWSFYHSQAAVYARVEQSERLRASREQIIAADLNAKRKTLKSSPDFEARSSAELETAIDAMVEFHLLKSKEARRTADRCQENRWQNETAALWCWDPFAPDVP
jgi:hypothetical protein